MVVLSLGVRYTVKVMKGTPPSSALSRLIVSILFILCPGPRTCTGAPGDCARQLIKYP